MAKIHGRGVVYTLDGESLSQYGTSVTWSRSADTHDVTTFGKVAKVYASGLKDGTATLEGIYDSTASTGPALVLEPLLGGAEVVLVYSPEGTGTGKPLKTVDVILSSYEESAPVADMITWTAELQMSDDVAVTTGV